MSHPSPVFCKRFQHKLKNWNDQTQKHLHILSKTTAVENSNELIQSMSQQSFTQTEILKTNLLYTTPVCKPSWEKLNSCMQLVFSLI